MMMGLMCRNNSEAIRYLSCDYTFCNFHAIMFVSSQNLLEDQVPWKKPR